MRAAVIGPERFSQELSDGYSVLGRYWPARADSGAKCAFLYLHGIQSHGGWYEWSGSLIANATGAAVLMPDRRGSGLNRAARGDVASGSRWLADLGEHCAELQRRAHVGRIAVVGVSWGGKLAAAFVEGGAAVVDDVLLIAPGIFPQIDLKWFQKLDVGFSLLRHPEQQFPIPLNDSKLFTDQPDAQRFIDEDPLKLTHVSARFLIESRRLDRRLARMERGTLQAGVHLMLAEHEHIVRNDETIRWAMRVPARRAQVDVFAGSWHSLEFAKDTQQYEDCLIGWARTSARL